MAEAKEDSTDAGSNNGIIGEPDKTNPLQKLMEGFCSPQKMMARAPLSYDDDEDDEDDTADQYAPDLAPQTPTTKQNGNGNGNGNGTLQKQEETQAAEKATDIDIDIDTDIDTDTDTDTATATATTTETSIPDSEAINKNTSKVISESTTPTDEDKSATTPKTTMAATPSADDRTSTQESSTPELDIPKRVTANRRKRGTENLIMACVFVLTTLLTLKKLGFTTSDFDFSAAAGGNGTSSSWIHVFDKQSSIEEQGKIKVKAATKKKPPSEPVVEHVDEEAEEKETSNDYDDISSEAVVDEL